MTSETYDDLGAAAFAGGTIGVDSELVGGYHPILVTAVDGRAADDVARLRACSMMASSAERVTFFNMTLVYTKVVHLSIPRFPSDARFPLSFICVMILAHLYCAGISLSPVLESSYDRTHR